MLDPTSGRVIGHWEGSASLREIRALIEDSLVWLRGAADPVAQAYAVALRAAMAAVEPRIVLAGAKHEILQERDQLREQLWAAFDAYIPGSAVAQRSSEQEQAG